MNFNELNAFIAVAEELNFRKAADRLGMSQPPLSRLIAKLEDDLGTDLFLRTTRHVSLTGAGLALLSKSRVILEQIAEAEKSVREVGRLKKGSLTIQFSSQAFYSSLPKLVWNYKERFPQMNVHMRERPEKDLLQDLKKGNADLVFLAGPVQFDGGKSMAVHSESLGILLPQDHKFAKRKSLQLSDLKDETFILHPRKEMSNCHQSLIDLLRDHVPGHRIYYKKSGESCPILVATQQGLLLTTKMTQKIQTPGTVYVPLLNPTAHLTFHAGWSSSNPSTELESFINFVKEQKLLSEPPQGCLIGMAQGWKA